jgi:hypothetical protein
MIKRFMTYQLGIGVLAAALLSSASAEIRNTAPRQNAGSFHLFCPMTSTVSRQDRNPATSAEITGDIRGGRIASLEVTYTLLDGRTIRRGDQYVNTRLWSDANGNILWSGTMARDPRNTVEGQISGGSSGVYSYSERHFRDGRLDNTIVTPCVQADGGGDNSSSF